MDEEGGMGGGSQGVGEAEAAQPPKRKPSRGFAKPVRAPSAYQVNRAAAAAARATAPARKSRKQRRLDQRQKLSRARQEKKKRVEH